MPVGVGEIVDNLCRSVTSNSLVTGIVGNPIWTSLAILLCIVLMALWVFRDVDTYDESLIMLCMRLAGYMSILVVGIVFLHNQAILADCKKEADYIGRGEVFEEPIIPASDLLPVKISPQFAE